MSSDLQPGQGLSRSPFGPYQFPSPLSYPGSIQAAGAFAAPILAGFSVTMISIILPSLGDKTKPAFTRLPELTLLLLVLAALCLIAAVQAAVVARSWDVSPASYREWWPNEFSAEVDAAPSARVINSQRQAFEKNLLWSKVTRLAYNIGVIALLAGVTVALVPPTDISPARWLVIGVAGMGALAEATWTVITSPVVHRARSWLGLD